MLSGLRPTAIMSQSAPTSSLALNRYEIALVIITVFWGATFLIVQKALVHSDPFVFVGMRFGCAALAMMLCSLRILRGLTSLEVRAGMLIGLCIFLGYSLQTVGLQTIASSKSAFITALYVPLVPLMQWLFLKRPPTLMNWIGATMAFIGLVLLADPQSMEGGAGTGEWLTVFSAIAIAVEVILISRFAGQVDLRRVTIVQLATAVIQITMNWAQNHISATRATVIYAGEPVWAGIIGRVFADERHSALALFGAVLIIVSVVVSEFKLRVRRRPPAALP
ncbi:EamA-like transporter family protein [Advenella incenata]|uniref:EamA-like transporter family protein n=1 Tax=Advenella incenata TaxID=267800 RepID=A0A4Q7VB15_9BURK|nr:DMT family transporter [Advenella incenata]RZT93991.1 EamA-like transporter family protein [Advenella incenata]